MSDLGDISLNSVRYRILLDTLRVSDIVDFAPRAATPGGSIIHSELGLRQPLLQTDWRHGQGFMWHTDASGYMRSEGNIDTRHAGVVMLFTNISATGGDTNNATKEGGVIFNGKLYTYGSDGVRVYDGNNWAAVAGLGTAVNGLLATQSYLFVLQDGARLKKVSTADVVSDAGADANSTDYKWAVIHGGYMYFGKDGTNYVYRTDQVDAGDLEGTPSSTTITVGAGGFATLGAKVYAGKLYVFRPDGIWMVENNVATPVLSYSNEASSNNFRSVDVFNGLLTFPLRDKIFQWNGARVSDITPPQWSDAFPYGTYGRFDNFVAIGSYLFMTARTNEATYNEDLLVWDGTGWHKLARLITSATGTITAMFYDVLTNRLWVHIDDAADTTEYFQFQDLSEFPYSAFPTTGTHTVISSRLDMGFRRVRKSMSSMLVEVSNVTSGRPIKVYYSLDGGAWVLWSTLTTNGVNTLTLPGGNNSVEFYYMQLKFELSTNSAAQTPVLEGMTVRFIMRPLVAYGHSFVVVMENNAQYGDVVSDLTAEMIRTNLRTLRDSAAPIAFTDIHGDTYQVYISSLVEYQHEQNPEQNEEGEANFYGVMQVNVVEVD